MGAYIPEGYGELAFRFSLVGDPQEMLMTVGFSTDTPGTGSLADLTTAAQDVVTEFQTNVFVNAPEYVKQGWSYLGAKATINAGAGPIPVLLGDPIVGTDVGETPPVNVALLIQKYTGIGGRKGRGRMYAPPWALSESAISKQGVFTEASRAALTEQYRDWLAAVNGGSAARLVLLHSLVLTDPGPPPVYEPPAEDPYIITDLYVDSVVATQRRRLRP